MNFISIGDIDHDKIMSIKKDCDKLRSFIHEIDRNIENVANTHYDKNMELTAQETDEIKKVGLMLDLVKLFDNPSTCDLLEYLQTNQQNNNSRHPPNSNNISTKGDMYDTDPSYRRNVYRIRNEKDFDNNDFNDFSDYNIHRNYNNHHMNNQIPFDSLDDLDARNIMRFNTFNISDDNMDNNDGVGIVGDTGNTDDTDDSDASDIRFDEQDYDEFISILTSTYLNIQYKSTLVNNYSFTRSYN